MVERKSRFGANPCNASKANNPKIKLKINEKRRSDLQERFMKDWREKMGEPK